MDLDDKKVISMERKSDNFSWRPNRRCTNLLSQIGQLD